MSHRFQNVLGVLVAVVACDGSADHRLSERVGTATDALVSAEFNIACDPVVVGSPPYAPGLAVNGGVAMASWVSPDGTIHAARFDDEGNVLDTGPLLLGRPVAMPAYGNWQAMRGTQLIAMPTGWVVLAQFKAIAPIGWRDTVHWRQLDLGGTPLGDWQMLDFADGNFSVASTVYLGNGGWDGTNWYATSRLYYPQGSSPTSTLRVHENGSPGTIISLSSYWNGSTYVQPQWGGFGCGANGCFATWQEANTGLAKTQVMGQPEQVVAALHIGSVVGTPSGFLSINDEIVEYTPTGVEVGTGATGLPSFSRGVFDGSVTRILSQENGDILSTTADDSGALLAPLALEIPGANSAQRGSASFGGGRVVLAHALATGVVGQFLGSPPSSVPMGCWATPGTGGGPPTGGGGAGQGGVGGDGGAPSNGGGGAGGVMAGAGGAPSVGGAAAGGETAAGGQGGAGTTSSTGGSSSGGSGAEGGQPAVGGADAGGAPPSTGGSPSSSGGSSPTTGGADTGGAGPGGEDSGSIDGCSGSCSVMPARSSEEPGRWLLAVGVVAVLSRRRGRRSSSAPH